MECSQFSIYLQLSLQDRGLGLVWCVLFKSRDADSLILVKNALSLLSSWKWLAKKVEIYGL